MAQNPDGSYVTEAPDVGVASFHMRKVIDPRADFEDQATLDKEYIGYIGAENWHRYVRVANDWSNNEVKWTNINTPGIGFLIDKKWFIEYDVKVNIHDIPVTSSELYPFRGSESLIGFRPYGFNYCAESIMLMLNNRTMTCNPHDSLYARMEYWPQPMLKLSNGCCPHRKPNGQTFADMDLRKGNSPFCSMAEFNDQDYPNTTLPTILSIQFNPGTVARGSNFERAGIPRSVRVSNKFKYTKNTDECKWLTNPKGSAGNGADADLKAGEQDWGEAQIGFNAAIAYLCYKRAKIEYALLLKAQPGRQISIEQMNTVKRQAAENAYRWVVGGTATNQLWDDDTVRDKTKLKDFECNGDDVGKFIDLDLVPPAYERFLLESFRAFYFEKGKTIATVYWFQSCSLTPGSYELVARIREPVIAEPLDYTSSAEFGRTMWNISTFELKYNLSQNLRHMLMIDDYKLMSTSDIFWCFRHNLGYVEGQKDIELINDAHIDVSLNSAPKLIYNVATPFVMPRLPYVCQHKQFKRYESHDSDRLKVEAGALENFYMNPASGLQRPIKTTSDNISLSFHPNSIFIWVSQRKQDRNESPDKFTRADSYAKITNLKISYGNSGNLMTQFDDHELFQMSLRNGLQDRSYLDWCATMKNITVPTDFYGNAANLGWTGRRYIDCYVDDTKYEKKQTEPTLNPAYNRYAGVGSVVRLIPGIDLVNGNSTNPLIAGMRAGNSCIQIECDFVPLNAYEETDYALNVMFEYDGVCTIEPGNCDLGMIAIESFAQLKAAQKARTFRESYAYGAGLGDKVMNGLRFGTRLMKNLGIVTRSAQGRGFSNSIGNLGKSVKMSGGKLISQGELFKRY